MRAKCLPQECSTVAGSGLGTGKSCMLIARLPFSPLVFNFYTDYEPQKTYHLGHISGSHVKVFYVLLVSPILTSSYATLREIV